MRFLTWRLLATASAMFLCGCSNFFPTFNRTNILAAPAHGDRIPLVEVQNTLKCEVGEFFARQLTLEREDDSDSDAIKKWKKEVNEKRREDWKSRNYLRLKEGGSATIELTVTVGAEGGVEYAEVDLDKADLLTAILIAGGKDGIKAPKTELSGTGTTQAKVTMKMKQEGWMQPACNDLLPRYSHANRLNPFTVATQKLGVGNWLDDFFERTNGDAAIRKGPEASLKEIQLETKFVLVAGIASSVKRWIKLVPINDFPIGSFEHTTTNTLTVTFEGDTNEDKEKGPSLSDCLLARAHAERGWATSCQETLNDWREKNMKQGT